MRRRGEGEEEEGVEEEKVQTLNEAYNMTMDCYLDLYVSLSIFKDQWASNMNVKSNESRMYGDYYDLGCYTIISLSLSLRWSPFSVYLYHFLPCQAVFI